jgi:hypothetical protein
MVHPFVASLVLSAKGGRDDLIDFKDVLVSEVEATSRTLPLLKCEESRLLVLHERMVFQSLCPVGKISIVRTRISPHLYVALVMCIRVLPEKEGFFLPICVFEVGATSKLSFGLNGLSFP